MLTRMINAGMTMRVSHLKKLIIISRYHKFRPLTMGARPLAVTKVVFKMRMGIFPVVMSILGLVAVVTCPHFPTLTITRV